MKPLVSICIPVYNSEDTIRETLETALAQDYENYEVVIVDNASTDQTVACINEFSDARIHLYQNETNLGMVGNWNKILEYAKGDFLHFLCADDLCISKKMDMMLANDDMNFVTSATLVINEDGQRVLERHMHRGDAVFDGKTLAKKSFHRKNMFGEPSSALIRTKRIKEVGGFATTMCYGTDWEMWLRIAAQGTVGYIDDVLSKYRVSTSNETSSLKLRRILDDDKAMVACVKQYEEIHFTKLDIAIHKVMYALRSIARNAFMKLQQIKNK